MASPGADAGPAAAGEDRGGSRRVPHLRAVGPAGPPPDGTTGPAADPTPGRAMGLGAHVAYAAVVLIVGVGVAATAISPSHWLRGVLLIGVGLAGGAVARAMLPERRVGLLAVRTRAFDASCLAALAVLIIAVGFVIPH